MFCSNCGSKIQEGSKVCPFCRQRIISSTTKGFANDLLNLAVDKIDAVQNSDFVAGFKDRVMDRVDDIQQSDFVQDIKEKATDKISSMHQGGTVRTGYNQRPVNKVSLKCQECGGEMVRNGSVLYCPFCSSSSYINESDSVKRAQYKRDVAINRQNKRHEIEMLKEKNRREETQQNTKRLLIMLVGMLVLIIAIIAILASMGDKDKKEKKEAATNTSNTVIVETNIEDNETDATMGYGKESNANDIISVNETSNENTEEVDFNETIETDNELSDIKGLSLAEAVKLVDERDYKITYFYSTTNMDATGDVEAIKEEVYAQGRNLEDEFYFTGRVVKIENFDSKNKTADIYFIAAQTLKDMQDGTYIE